MRIDIQAPARRVRYNAQHGLQQGKAEPAAPACGTLSDHAPDNCKGILERWLLDPHCGRPGVDSVQRGATGDLALLNTDPEEFAPIFWEGPGVNARI